MNYSISNTFVIHTTGSVIIWEWCDGNGGSVWCGGSWGHSDACGGGGWLGGDTMVGLV